MEINEKIIQWYPGHMAKARRLMKEKMAVVDIVFELVDARVPFSSRNPYITELIGNKPHIILLNKADLADEAVTKEFKEYFNSKGIYTVDIVSTKKDSIKKVFELSKLAYEPILEKRRKKGYLDRPLRAMIVGVPNVGKSTLINKIAGKNVCVTGDKAGITRTNQWIKLNQDIDLLDTPGILWNKFLNEDQGYRLASTNALKREILPFDDVVIYAMKFLLKNYYKNVDLRYDLSSQNIDTEDIINIFDHIGKKRGAIRKKGEVDYDRVLEIIFNDLKDGYLGRVTYDRVFEEDRFKELSK